MVLPIASVCSTRPPVSVLVRAPAALPRSFSRDRGISYFAHSLRRRALPLMVAAFNSQPGHTLSRGRPEPRQDTLIRHSFGHSGPPAVQECLPAVHRLRLSASP